MNLTGPAVMVLPALPSRIAPTATRIPRPAGAATENHISSSDHAIGWYTVTTTVARVRAIMISVNSRLPIAPLPVGTAIAIQPRTPVSPIIPRIRTKRPRAERARIRMPRAPMA